MADKPITLCELLPETTARIDDYVESLTKDAPTIGHHGLSQAEFWKSRIFQSAVERIRGINAASMGEKRAFINSVLAFLKEKKLIDDATYLGAGERFDYLVKVMNRIAVIEAKGCLDGNNTNIFERPPQADEFVIWSLCQNPGADPRHNSWSGIHTRLGAEVISRKQRVDALVIWDMICGTAGRPCPKTKDAPQLLTDIPGGQTVPPPCIYLFPRSVPDPRNNPNPESWELDDLRFVKALWTGFNGSEVDIVKVKIEVQMKGPITLRRTRFFRQDGEFATSGWTKLKRVR